MSCLIIKDFILFRYLKGVGRKSRQAALSSSLTSSINLLCSTNQTDDLMKETVEGLQSAALDLLKNLVRIFVGETHHINGLTR